MLDHQAYMESFDQCRAWLAVMKDKVARVIDTSGDKSTVQDRLQVVQVSLGESSCLCKYLNM